MTDQDLELLDQYLDGALSDDEERALETRLRAEPALAAELSRLKSDRDLRKLMWQGIETGVERSVQPLLMRVEAALDRRENWKMRIARFRVPAAAAACILVGFMAGWVGRTSPMAGPGGGAMARNDVEPNREIQFPGISLPRGRAATAYDVALKDEAGKVVAVQHFENLEKAREFADDLGHWQERQTQAQNGNVVLVGDRF